MKSKFVCILDSAQQIVLVQCKPSSFTYDIKTALRGLYMYARTSSWAWALWIVAWFEAPQISMALQAVYLCRITFAYAFSFFPIIDKLYAM